MHTLFDSPKNAVFAEILVFGSILGFPGVNFAQRWTKTVNFEYVPFPPKFEFLKYFSSSIFWMLRNTSGEPST